MDFFVAWTNRDPIFQSFDPQANILVSPHHVTQNWCVSDWEQLPSKLIIDSGAFNYKKQLTPGEIITKQVAMAKGWENPKTLFFSHPDLFLPKGVTFSEMIKLINKSIQRAKIYIEQLRQKKVNCNPIGVIHGFDTESLIASYFELKEAGYKHFAIGSLAVRVGTNKSLCIKIIRILSDYLVYPLHIFGVLWPSYAQDCPNQISSFDSASPSKLGFYGTVIYGHKLKKYVISPDAEQQHRDRFWNFREGIPSPLPCICPICKDDPMRLVPKKNRNAKIDRAIHNYFQIKWATQALN